MAGPRPDDPYNPTASVQPNTGMPADYLTQRANPNDFGAQTGEALQRTGQTFGDLANKAMDFALKQQGMINETLATNAESQYAEQAGLVYGKYKELKGLDAVHAREGAVNDILALRQKIQGSLPNPAAQRAFSRDSRG